MSKTKKAAKQPSVAELEDRIHRGYHFLLDWSNEPDSDNWRVNYVDAAIRILYPDDFVDLVTNQSADILEKRTVDTMQYLLEAGTEGRRNEDDLFRLHVLTAVTILGGTHHDRPIHHR